MSDSSITASDTCPKCGQLADHSFGERAYGPRVHKFESWHCRSCGLLQESDGYLSDELHERLLAKFGRFAVVILTSDRPQLLVALRSITTLSLQEVAALSRRLPGVYASDLTRPEATALAERATRAGLLAEVRSA